MGPVSRTVRALLPPLCPVCRGKWEDLRPACPDCMAILGRSSPLWLGGTGRVAWIVSAFLHEGIPRKALAAYKFSNRVGLAELMAARMAESLADVPLSGSIVPIPSHPLRSRLKGFEPTATLALQLAGLLPELDLATESLRRRDLGGQRGRTRLQRLSSPPQFSSRRVLGDILLVDDVVTTGATLKAAARAVYSAGAGRVRAVTFARES